MSTQHTPGPWSVERDRAKSLSLYAGTTFIGEVYHDKDEPSTEEQGNVNLIAAAPAMYEALRMLTSEINLSTLNVRKDFSLMNAHACAVKAILQAEGKLL